MPGSTDAGGGTARLGFGTWALGGSRQGTLGYGVTSDDESRAALAEAYALGCTAYDTSNLYGWGHAERLLGDVLAGVRAQIRLGTKAGYVTPDGDQDFSPDAIRRSLDGSLERLRTGYVDLLQLHNPPPEALAEGSALFAMLDRLRADGIARSVGVSARTPDEALTFVERYPLDAVQVNFNLTDQRALRNGLFDRCMHRGIRVIVRTPLAAGFLTGTLASDAAFGAGDHRSRFDAGTRARWIDAAARMRPVFSDVPEATPAQNALRFCLSYDAVSCVLPGMMHVSEVRENLAAAPLPRLTAAQLRALDAAYEATVA